MRNWINFGTHHRQKYVAHQKKPQVKVVWNWISYKKVREHIGLSLPWLDLGSSKGFQRSGCLKSFNVQKYEIRFTLALSAANNTHYIKKASNKSCSELNFVQKSQWTRICLSTPRVEPGALKICTFEILKCTEMEKSPSSTPGADGHMRPLTFLYEIQFWTTFI